MPRRWCMPPHPAIPAQRSREYRNSFEEQVEDLAGVIEHDRAEAVGCVGVQEREEVIDGNVYRKGPGVDIGNGGWDRVPTAEGRGHQGHRRGVVEGAEVAEVGVEGIPGAGSPDEGRPESHRASGPPASGARGSARTAPANRAAWRRQWRGVDCGSWWVAERGGSAAIAVGAGCGFVQPAPHTRRPGVRQTETHVVGGVDCDFLFHSASGW
jgi:hypothetical protein